MTSSFQKLFVFLIIILTLPALAADSIEQEKPEAQIIATVNGFHDALSAGESTRALDYLADDVVILESGGMETKHHYQSGHIKGDIRFAQSTQTERSDMNIKIDGKIAWASSTSVTRGEYNGHKINSKGAELVVLALTDGTWKIKAMHWSSRKQK